MLDEVGFVGGAVFCSSDLLAHGVLIEAQARGMSVPESIAVVGFGDQDFAAHVTPPLTTVRVNRHTLGTAAAEAILARIGGGNQRDNVIDIEFDIVCRASAQISTASGVCHHCGSALSSNQQGDARCRLHWSDTCPRLNRSLDSTGSA